MSSGKSYEKNYLGVEVFGKDIHINTHKSLCQRVVENIYKGKKR
jgi:hypothetical protein